MNHKLTKTENIIDNIVQNKVIVLVIIIIFLLIAIVLTFFQKKEYSSNAQVLIIQEQEHQMDAYLASKSSESLAKNLKEAILTSSFRNKVSEDMEDPEIQILKSEKNRRKEWSRIIDVKIIPNTSILEIRSYYPSAFQSEKILNKILDTLLKNHQLYHGGGEDIRLEIINNPLTSNRPVRPNWILNLSLSFILALFFIVTLLILFPNKINFLDTRLKKNKVFNVPSKKDQNKTNFKVFDYLEKSSPEKVELPEDLFEEEIEEDNQAGFFAEDEDKWNDSFSGSKNNNLDSATKEIEEDKKIIDNNHYLKRKE